MLCIKYQLPEKVTLYPVDKNNNDCMRDTKKYFIYTSTKLLSYSKRRIGVDTHTQCNKMVFRLILYKIKIEADIYTYDNACYSAQFVEKHAMRRV